MKHRLFIAINLPKKLKEKLEKLVLELGKRNNNLPIKWVDSQGLHLTLLFLGYVEDQRISIVGEMIEKVAVSYKPFNIRVGGIDAFPNLGNPRVIFLNCQEVDGERAQNIQKAIGVELKREGFDVESRPWHEHITLGRIKDKCRLNIPRVEISDGEFEIKSIELMESTLTPAGAKYNIVKSFKLG